MITRLEEEESSRQGNTCEGFEAERPAKEQSGWRSATSKEANPPLQFAELREDLIALILHLSVNAHYVHALHQGLQSLSTVLHAGARAARGDRGLRVAGRLGPPVTGGRRPRALDAAGTTQSSQEAAEENGCAYHPQLSSRPGEGQSFDKTPSAGVKTQTMYSYCLKLF